MEDCYGYSWNSYSYGAESVGGEDALVRFATILFVVDSTDKTFNATKYVNYLDDFDKLYTLNEHHVLFNSSFATYFGSNCTMDDFNKYYANYKEILKAFITFIYQETFMFPSYDIWFSDYTKEEPFKD